MLSTRLIDEAERFLAGKIRTTPVEASPALSERLGVPVFLKLECLQVTGSFKVRGALFALADRAPDGGVATCSAGNHGIGLAHAATLLGVPATIYVPSGVDGAKADALRRLHATVHRSPFPGFDDTEAWAVDQAARAGLPYVSAYDDDAILAANGGTLAREILRQVPDVRTVILPVGGGGMAGGLAFALESAGSKTRIVAAQLAASPALARSFEAGRAVTRMPAVDTVAGGLEGGLGRAGFAVLDRVRPDVSLVSEAALRSGVRWMLAHHRYVIEPSAAVAVAAACAPDRPLEGPVVVVISGRNVSLDTLRSILQEDQHAPG